MKKLTDLEPKLVWEIFHEITQVPRPSKKEGKIQAYLIRFAEKYGLEWKQDPKGNIVIIRPASPGREGESALILQSHMDMVCEKDAGVEIDFENDPIEACVDGDWVKARGTTLGADCGIGMALQMAVLIDPELKVPRIEALFTVDEEQGLTGAMHLGADMLTGNRMINLDSEDEGEIFIGCAGGIDTIASLKYQPEKAPEKGYVYYTISIRGLNGGHSGDDIEKGYANSNKLLNRLLWNLYWAFGVKLSRIDGGNLRNAIPREAEALIGVPERCHREAIDLLTVLRDEITAEYKHAESNIAIVWKAFNGLPEWVLPEAETVNLLNALYAVPHGVVAMSFSMPGLVETSTNLASVKMPEGEQGGEIVVTTSQRSSLESAKRDVAAQVESVFRLAGMRVAQSDGYPGWTPNPDSPLVRKSAEIYTELFGKKPKIKAIHAGLECGLFLSRYPNLDIISTGPTLRGVHSPAERIEIESVGKVWVYLQKMIQGLEM